MSLNLYVPAYLRYKKPGRPFTHKIRKCPDCKLPFYQESQLNYMKCWNCKMKKKKPKLDDTNLLFSKE